ncbi:TPA: hypothetical protein ACPHWC_006313 [Pseudomonas aeruginosa]|uniref:hypothetical protein n=1 Tax=Pseudomonas aeruginosa TaxID=287 RepID=UPI00053D196E|nr:hypothetical protein [Pseudomonas aeruginosa]EIU5460379.1 hypothetical protein [Pseudomonas aeruginosa]EIU5543762.1 hypothetical protein [Pseudomonas aeruginosa]EKW4494352.1 hypothetical protein [Pseudomonas aeruginosa]EKY0078185.1 hypothetical protein [Pseudomonas aeruginosa]EKY0500311.1 hypothetical protein [Pseudomonas aeruginosa]
MAAGDLELTAGTTFAFSATWQQQDNDGAALVPIDISGCRARFQAREVESGRLLLDAQTEGRGVTIPAGSDGTLTVSLSPTTTRGLPARRLGEVEHELRVYFPSGDAYAVLTGFLVIRQGVIRDQPDP